MNIFQELKQLIDGIDETKFIQDPNCDRFYPKEHQRADAKIGPFIIYDIRKEKDYKLGTMMEIVKDKL